MPFEDKPEFGRRTRPRADRPKWLKWFWIILAFAIVILIVITAYSQAQGAVTQPEKHPPEPVGIPHLNVLVCYLEDDANISVLSPVQEGNNYGHGPVPKPSPKMVCINIQSP